MGGTSHALGAGLLAVAALLSHTSALAQAEAPARAATVLVPRCDPPFGGPRFARLLRLELGLAGIEEVTVVTLGPEETAPEAPLIVHFRAGCGETGTVLVVVAAAGGPSVHQSVDMTELAAEMRPRTMAVAAAEQARLQHLIAERERETGRPAAPAPEAPSAEPARLPATRSLVVPLPSPPPPEPQAPPPPPERLGAFWIAFEARGFPESGTWPLGARVGAVFDLPRPLRFGLDVGASFASGDHPSGQAELWLLTAGLLAAVRLEPTPWLALAPGVRVDVGYATLAGRPTEGSTRRGQGASVALAATARVAVSPSERFAIFGDLDLGVTLLGHRGLAGPEPVVATTGLATALRVGFALTL